VRVAVTGTPGTGKTSATDLLKTDLDVLHLNDLIEREGLFTEVDEARTARSPTSRPFGTGSKARTTYWWSLTSRTSWTSTASSSSGVRRGTGAPPDRARRASEKAEENAESESLDVILSESVRIHGEGNIYEIDTTDRDPEAVAAAIEAAISGDRDPSAGDVDFTDYL